MLIKVALCEDIISDQETIKHHVHQWAKEVGHQIHFKAFSDSNKLLGSIGNSFETYDVYLLDIVMQRKQEGLELAQIIRKQSEHIPIIFITTHSELAIASYDVHALNFIAKPVKEERLFPALDMLAKILEQRNTQFFTCTIDGVMRRFPLYDIFYLKSDDHYILINGDIQLRFRGTMDEIVSAYPENFVYTLRGLAVNIAHVSCILFNDMKVVLTNGIELPVSKNYSAWLRRDFRKFFSIV